MTKKHNVYRWCWMWQSDKKTIEDVLEEGLSAFYKRYGNTKPDCIYVCKDETNIRLYDRINLINDKSLFHIGIIMIPIPILEIKDNT